MNGLVVDLFAGFGGASLGIRDALGRDPDIAINHDPVAVAVHAANHPSTKHLHGDVWHYAPRDVVGRRGVDLLWASPTCTFFSQAKGAPLDRTEATRVRALAWVVTRWAAEVRPRIICVENVPQFEAWTTLLENGRPDPTRRGATFRAWVRKLERIGYAVEWFKLRASDFGAPTSRQRLFIVARCDGRPIEWPEPTHVGRERGAHEVIDWRIPAPSIFGRKRPLVVATCRRIARGVRRFVLDAAEPWIVSHYGTSTGKPIGAPLPTVTAGARHEALAVPYVIPASHAGDARVHGVEEPLRTITAASRSPFHIVAPSLVHVSNGERPGQAPRVYDVRRPLSTVVAGGVKHAVVAAHLVKHFGGKRPPPGLPMTAPLGTITTVDHHALVTCETIGDKREAVSAFMKRYDEAAPSLFPRDPTRICIGGDTFAIADIGMRLLEPRELARAHDFGDELALERDVDGRKVTRTDQIRLVGNSVPRKLAEAVLRANITRAKVVGDWPMVMVT